MQPGGDRTPGEKSSVSPTEGFGDAGIRGVASSGAPAAAQFGVDAVTDAARMASDRILAALPESAAGSSDSSLVEAVDRVTGLIRSCQSALALVSAEIEERSRDGADDSLARRHGQRNTAALLQTIGRLSWREARQVIAFGAAIAPDLTPTGATVPPTRAHLARAAHAGEVGAQAAETIIRGLDGVSADADPAMVDAAEEGMVQIAAERTPEGVSGAMRVWREALDPDGARPREEAQRRRRFLRLGAERSDGLTPLSGLLMPETAARLRAAISTHTNPRAAVSFSEDGTSSAAEEAGVGTRDVDPRSREQKLHDIFDGLITAGHRSSVTAGGSRKTMTEVVITTTMDDVRRGRAGWINGMDTPVGPEAVERIMCDEGYRRMLLGDDGEALWLGRRQGMFTAQQKLAIAVRDETCGWPECDIPADWCEVHHVTYRREGGPTDVDNGILLCSAHHHMLHSHDWTIRMVSGIPHLEPPGFLRHGRGAGLIRMGRNRSDTARRRRRGRRRDDRARSGSDPTRRDTRRAQ